MPIVNNIIPWNKGLTKFTDSRIAAYSKKLSGRSRSKEHCKSISLAKKGKKNPKKSEQMKLSSVGKGNMFYGRKHSEESKRIIGEKNRLRVHKRGYKIPSITGELNPAKRPEVRSLISKRVSETHWDSSGENNPNWKGGISNEPYSLQFNKSLKLKILEQHNNRCAICKMSNDEHILKYHLGLNIHHIDYTKKNHNEMNLIPLCISCHMKTNKDHGKWKIYFKEVMPQ